MIRVKTEYPIAYGSADHIHPEGIYYDNNLNEEFVSQVENYFSGRKINFLDIGCAGGKLVCGMYDRGHHAVGIDGSDHCLNVRPEMVDEVGFEPAGKDNWQKHGNKILFTCDASRPFSILEDEQLLQFDCITCFDVIEHFEPETLDTYIENVKKHLRDDGIFIATIALYYSGRHATSKNTPEGGVEYHKSVFPVEWWRQKFISHNLVESEYKFNTTNRGIPGGTYICWWQKAV